MLRPALLLLWLSLAPLFGLDLKSLQPQGYVSDFAGVIDPVAKQAIEQYCRSVEDSTGAQLAFVTLVTLDGEPVEDVANTLYRQWGIGKKDTNEGALFLLAINDRRSRLEVGYGLEPVLPDGAAGGILREMRPALQEGRYGEAMRVAAAAVGERIAASKGVQIAGSPRPRRPARREATLPLLPVLVMGGLLFFFMYSSGMGRGIRRGGYYGPGPWIGGGSSGGSRGGFGGYDGGGFGGFGGGDSGGGGASSSW